MARDKKANPTRLYRNKERGILMGVCAGIADYFDFNVTIIRILLIICLFVFFVPTFIGYLLAGFLLKDKPRELKQDPKRDEFWKSARTAPKSTIAESRHKFMELESRLRKMEERVTSKEFQFDQDLNNETSR